MNRLACVFLVCTGITTGQGFIDSVVAPKEIKLLSKNRVKKADATKALAYILDAPLGGRPRIVEVRFDANPVAGGLELVGLKCVANGTPLDLDLEAGQAGCGLGPLGAGKSREVTIQFLGVEFAGMTKPVDVSMTVAYRRKTERLYDPKVIAGERELYVGAELAIKPQLLEDLKKPENQRAMKVKLKFDPKDTELDYDVHVTGVKASGKDEPVPGNEAGDYIKISFSKLLPSRPFKYTVLVSLDKNLLSQKIRLRVDPDAKELVIPMPMEASTTPDRDHADFYLDMTLTSYVNPFDPTKKETPANNGQRRNVGIFGLSYAPEGKQWQRGLSGSGGASWFAVVPYLKADVSTLPLKEAKVPTQVSDGVDLVYGYNMADAGAALRGMVFTAGGKHESDRDFKFQIATGRFTMAPVVNGLEQTRAYRDRVAAGRKKSFVVTAYAFRPKIGYEIGNVVRDRPERLLDNVTFQDYISRFLVNFDMSVELKKFLTVSASDVYYYHWKVDRRPQRNYLEAKLDFNAGYLFPRFGRRALSYGITGKFQRGEQSPTFTPVNVFSIGVTFVH